RMQALHVIVRALKGRGSADIAALMRTCAPSLPSNFVRRSCLAALAQLGRLDAAFAFADIVFPEQHAPTREQAQTLWLHELRQIPEPATLFYPQLAPLRADPRFVSIAARLGLLDYWRTSGHAPDFCATEGSDPICIALVHAR